MRPPTATRPRRRLDDPGEQAQQRRLAGAVAADEPDGASGLDARTRRPAAPTPRAAHAAGARTKRSFSARLLARVHAEAAARHARRRSRRASCRVTVPPAPAGRCPRASARTPDRRSASRSASSRMPELRARARSPRRRCPSGSRGDPRRSRRGRRARLDARRGARRWSRMSGPSHGSPVGDSLWNENHQSRRRRQPRRRAARSRAAGPCTGRPASRIRAGSECAVKTTCASVPRIRSASSSTKPGSSCQLSTKRELARGRRAPTRAGRGSP